MVVLADILIVVSFQYVNSSPPAQKGHHFADNIFRYIFMNEKFCILKMEMAWRWTGEKP